MVPHGVGHVLVDGHQHLLVAPVEILLGVAAHHGIDHGGHTGLAPSAHVVEIHHALPTTQNYVEPQKLLLNTKSDIIIYRVSKIYVTF